MFHGSIPALVTPFKSGAVDERALQDLVEMQIRAGSAALTPCGTTGESTTLSHEEHRRVVALCVEAAGGRVPVIAGAGSNCTDEAIELTRFAQSCGANAVLSVAPYYNRPSQDGLYAHFAAIHEASDIPIILYNVPPRTSCDIEVETVARLSQLARVVGVKDASKDLARVAQHRRRCGDAFALLSGEDSTALGFNAHGGDGCISVTANVAPGLCAQLQAMTRAGDYQSARAIDVTLSRLNQALFAAPSPGPIKYACSLLGLCAPDVRLPLIEPNEAVKAEVRAAMGEAGLL